MNFQRLEEIKKLHMKFLLNYMIFPHQIIVKEKRKGSI